MMMPSRPLPTAIQADPERDPSSPEAHRSRSNPMPLSPVDGSLTRLATLERAARSQQQSRTAAETPDEITALEVVYRYSILSSRIKVLRHEIIHKVESAQSLIDVSMPEELRRDLDQYSIFNLPCFAFPLSILLPKPDNFLTLFSNRTARLRLLSSGG